MSIAIYLLLSKLLQLKERQFGLSFLIGVNSDYTHHTEKRPELSNQSSSRLRQVAAWIGRKFAQTAGKTASQSGNWWRVNGIKLIRGILLKYLHAADRDVTACMARHDVQLGSHCSLKFRQGGAS